MKIKIGFKNLQGKLKTRIQVQNTFSGPSQLGNRASSQTPEQFSFFFSKHIYNVYDFISNVNTYRACGRSIVFSPAKESSVPWLHKQRENVKRTQEEENGIVGCINKKENVKRNQKEENGKERKEKKIRRANVAVTKVHKKRRVPKITES